MKITKADLKKMIREALSSDPFDATLGDNKPSLDLRREAAVVVKGLTDKGMTPEEILDILREARNIVFEERGH